MKKFLAIFALLVALPACGLLSPVVEKIADGVERYCEEPYAFRQQYRNTVNSQLSDTGHRVHVHCAGDADSEIPE